MIRSTSTPRAASLISLCAAVALSACAKTVPAPSGLGEPCIANADCATGFLCAAGHCVLPANLGGCEPDRLRCNGAQVEKCDANGLSYSSVTICPTGCADGACSPQICSPGAARCEGDAAEQCTPSGGAWALVQICPSHCDATTGLCKAPVCAPFSTRCDPAGDTTRVEICDSYGAGWQSQACGTSKTCDQGRCQDVICAAGQTRCSGDGGSIETCNAARDGYSSTTSCRIRCVNAGGLASCLQPVCTPGVTQCSAIVSNALEQCLPDGTGWSFVTFCATGCADASSVSASCVPPVCAPLQRKCLSDGSGVETCLANGTGYTQTDTCAQGCAAGNCITDSANCNAGDLRCNGADSQHCVQTAPGVTAWSTVETCVAGCSSGACLPGGSCTGVRLHAAVPSVPQDGVSTVLVYSDVIVGADGSAIPDGLEYTVAVTAPSGGGQPQLATTDADPAQAGVQVLSLAGRVRFRVLAPGNTAADVLATASATLVDGPSCAGSVPLTFSAASAGVVLVAEDFTLAADRDLAATTANWDLSRGAAVAAFPVDVGAGEDGALSVPSGSFDLSTSGFAPAFAVVGLSGRTVSLDGASSRLNGGDEVILWDVEGSSSGFSNAGTYELHHVASVKGTQVTLAEEIVASFGTQNDQDVATQRVVLQRIPHFSSLTVASGATLTADPWDGSKNGLLFLRVSGAATVQGEIKLDGAGYRGGKSFTAGEDGSSVSGAQQGAGGFLSGGGYATAGQGSSAGQPYGLPLLGRLFFGAGGGGGSNTAGGAGGGAIVIAAQSLSLASSGGAQQGRIHADGAANQNSAGSGAGGSVWVAARGLTLGTGTTGSLSAQGGVASSGGAAGGQGRVRLDYLSADNVGANCSRATPACNSAVLGPLTAQSLDVYDPAGSQLVRAATLVTALGVNLADGAGSSLISYQATNTAPFDFTLATPLSGPGSFQFSTAGPGPHFRWRALLSPLAGAPQALLGLQWQLTVN